MKNGLPILIIVVALLALGGVYAYRQMNKTVGVNLPSYSLSGTAAARTGGGMGGIAVPTPTQAPLNQISLTVTSPANSSTLTTSSVVVSGSTVANADVIINDTDVKADANGNFSTTLTLDEGENTIDIIASDADGNSSEQMLNVTYNPPGQ